MKDDPHLRILPREVQEGGTFGIASLIHFDGSRADVSVVLCMGRPCVIAAPMTTGALSKGLSRFRSAG
jgi:hypothetical protein